MRKTTDNYLIEIFCRQMRKLILTTDFRSRDQTGDDTRSRTVQNPYKMEKKAKARCQKIPIWHILKMKIAIIGGGAAGLAALKHSLDEHHECELFEQTGLIGGTWNYSEKIGIDENGLPIHSSMYKGLRTNLPKELMQLEDFPFSKPDYSYVSQPQVLEYINDYANHFNLLSHVQVSICHRSPPYVSLPIPEELKKKIPIQEFRQHSVLFSDGSEENVEDVILCTGYLYNYPFLSNECEIKVENKWVKYLYKHIININHPTMAFIGIPTRVFPFVLFGIQIRFFLAYLKGNFSISKDKMMEDLETYMNNRKAEGQTAPHFLSLKQGEYMEDLGTIARIKKVPPVFAKLYKYVHKEGIGNIATYKILNDNDFEIVKFV
ncbi:senecionine N-oxygenase-like isoform X5 [Diabrotica virgifera virgifera]|uniref:Flavin-containing monooxygenase n=1 Tax=Diabrotica virgifera virgifera TaxID=50390 RepID=A0A6P7F2U1_DIAVI|nr:senecionine N-oxygenase-like isoform X5 [Diabrotica virgifera virgifera]